MKPSTFAVALVAVLVRCESPNPTELLRDAAITSPSGVLWSVFWGGNKEDQFRDVATEAQGDAIMVGGSASQNYPTTAGTDQPVHSSSTATAPLNMDAIVTKVAPDGSLIWSTFLGGNGYDRAYAVEVDPQGFIIVAGRAGQGFPTTAGTVQTVFGGGGTIEVKYGPQDGFACKLTSAGSKVWCTYFGKNELNIIRDMDVDDQGNIYLATSTQTTAWPSTWFANAWQKTKKAGTDDLLVKLSPDGKRVVWATFIGGSQSETRTTSVRWTPGAIWYLTSTTSTDITSTNRALAGGADFWVGGFSQDGHQLLHSTYIGGTGTEGIETHNLAAEGDRVYIAAQSSSATFPLERTPYNGQHDGIVIALDTTAELIASRHVGTPGDDGLEGLTANGAGLCVAGFMSGRLTGVPLWGPGGQRDAALVCFDRDLVNQTYGLTVGGSFNDYARSIAEFNGELIGAAHSQSPDWPTLGSTATYGGLGDAVAFRVAP